MYADGIRQLLQATPFRPFTVYLASEKSFAVPHQDFAWMTPRGRTLVVALNDKEAVDLLDVALIARVEVEEKNGEKHVIKLWEKRGYFTSELYPEYDSDSEGEIQKAEEESKRRIKELLSKYTEKKTVFNNGDWLITNKERITNYKNYIKEYTYWKDDDYTKVKFENVKKIVRRRYAYERF